MGRKSNPRRRCLRGTKPPLDSTMLCAQQPLYINHASPEERSEDSPSNAVTGNPVLHVNGFISMPSRNLNRDISILYRLALFGQIMLRANTLRNRAPGFKREKLEKHISGLQKRS